MARPTIGPKEHGFTLVELMTVVILLVILATVAVPGMRDLIARNRLSAKLNELVGALQLTRSEAVTRNRSITLCRSANGTACGGTGWQGGWIVFADADQDGTVDTADGDIILHKSAAASPEFSISGPTGPTAGRFTYRSDGRVLANGTLTICHGTVAKGTVTVDPTGRPSGKKESTTTGC